MFDQTFLIGCVFTDLVTCHTSHTPIPVIQPLQEEGAHS